MSEIDAGGQQENVGDLVKALVLAIRDQSSARPSWIHYLNLGMMITILFGAGVFYQRVVDLESWRHQQDTRFEQLKSLDVMSVQIAALKATADATAASLNRMDDRLNRYIEHK